MNTTDEIPVFLRLTQLAQQQHAAEWDRLSEPIRQACVAEQLLQLIYSTKGDTFDRIRFVIDQLLAE